MVEAIHENMAPTDGPREPLQMDEFQDNQD
jgi:hypothetical protein